MYRVPNQEGNTISAKMTTGPYCNGRDVFGHSLHVCRPHYECRNAKSIPETPRRSARIG
jgi:hypothetical protein